MRATRWLHGSYRVGKDDIEWSVESVYFPAIEFHPSGYLIKIINETLNIKLEFDDDNLCFSYIEASDSEYVPWFARNEDNGSFDFQNAVFVKLVNKLLPLIETNSTSFFDSDF